MPETRLQKRLRQSDEALSNKINLHDSISGNTENTIGKKRKTTIRQDNKKTSRRTKEPCKKTRKSKIASSTNQDSASGLQCASQLLRLPAEILWSIASYLKPSELCSISRISKAFKNLVDMLPIWQQICTSLALGKPARKYKTYYALATTQMWRICDVCLTRTKGWGSDSPLKIKDIYGNDIGRLCCKCRCSYYKQNPEPVALVWNGDKQIDPCSQVTKSTATFHYKLPTHHLSSVPVDLVDNPHYSNAAPMQLYLESDVVDAARKLHGGDIGIMKAREATRARGIRMRETKRKKIQERRETLNKIIIESGLEHHRNSQVCSNFVSGHMTVDQLVKNLQARERQSQAQDSHRSLVRKELKSRGMPALIDQWEIEHYIREGNGCMEEIIQQLVNREHELQRLATARDARRSFVQKELESHNMPTLIYRWEIERYICEGKGFIEDIIRQVVDQEHELQRIGTVTEALKVRLNQIDNTLAGQLYLYENIIKDSSNDIESLLATIVNAEKDRKAKQAYKEEGRKVKQERRCLLIKKLSKQNSQFSINDARCAHYIAIGAADIKMLVQAIIDESNKKHRTSELEGCLMQHGINHSTNALAKLYIDLGEPELDVIVNAIIEETNESELRRNLLKAKLIESNLRIPPGDALCQEYIDGIFKDDIDTVVKHVANIPYEMEVKKTLQAKWLSNLSAHVFSMLLKHATYNSIEKWQSLLDTDDLEAEWIATQHLNQIGKDQNLPTQWYLELSSDTIYANAISMSSTVFAETSASCYSSDSSGLDTSLDLKTGASSNCGINTYLSETSSRSSVISKGSERLSDTLCQALGTDWLRQILKL